MKLEGQGASAESNRSGSDAGGYIMVALLVGIAIASVWMSAALPSWRQQAIREKEAELIFRGEQYARAIRLYQQKMNGALPSSFDDLISQHVLRHKWKDPITGEDFLPRAGCAAATVPGTGGPQIQNPAGNRGIINPFNPGMSQPGQTPIQPGRGPILPGGQTPGGSGQPVAGGICGVQSKSKAASIKIYNGQQEYDLWQFDTMTAALRYQQAVVKLGGGTAVPGQGIGLPVNMPGAPRGTGPFGPGGVPRPGGRSGPRGFGPSGGIGPGMPGPGGVPGRGQQPPISGGRSGR